MQALRQGPVAEGTIFGYLPSVGSVLVVGALVLAQSFLVNEHSAAPAMIALKEHFLYRAA